MPYCSRPVKCDEALRCPIVPVEQKRRAVRFVRFPGENHELSRSGKPTHRLRRFGHILDWCAEKLMTPAEVASEAAS